ncbi:MAG: hypothetical protein L6Q92_13670 [Phycisphaerae bacterium]|nr:hypothetical protein [Phycisphaerae bacterium]
MQLDAESVRLDVDAKASVASLAVRRPLRTEPFPSIVGGVIAQGACAVVLRKGDVEVPVRAAVEQDVERLEAQAVELVTTDDRVRRATGRLRAPRGGVRISEGALNPAAARGVQRAHGLVPFRRHRVDRAAPRAVEIVRRLRRDRGRERIGQAALHRGRFGRVARGAGDRVPAAALFELHQEPHEGPLHGVAAVPVDAAQVIEQQPVYGGERTVFREALGADHHRREERLAMRHRAVHHGEHVFGRDGRQPFGEPLGQIGVSRYKFGRDEVRGFVRDEDRREPRQSDAAEDCVRRVWLDDEVGGVRRRVGEREEFARCVGVEAAQGRVERLARRQQVESRRPWRLGRSDAPRSADGAPCGVGDLHGGIEGA